MSYSDLEEDERFFFRLLGFFMAIAFILAIALTVVGVKDTGMSQQDHDVITYNDGFIDGENNIIDQCKQIAGVSRVFYECPLPVVDR